MAQISSIVADMSPVRLVDVPHESTSLLALLFVVDGTDLSSAFTSDFTCSYVVYYVTD